MTGSFRSRVRRRSAWHGVANERTYAAPADPFMLVGVDPAEVTWYNGEIDLHWGVGRVEDGNWDDRQHCERVRELALYRGLGQRFVDGDPWAETAFYERAEAAFADDGSFRGYDSLASYERERLPYLDDLYASIRDDGYRPNREAGHEPASDENAFEDAYAHHFEVLVVVGRQGEVILAEGFHRFAIADLLGLDAIPVQVLCRHADWQAVRDRVAATPREDWSPALHAYADHPDVDDITA